MISLDKINQLKNNNDQRNDNIAKREQSSCVTSVLLNFIIIEIDTRGIVIEALQAELLHINN